MSTLRAIDNLERLGVTVEFDAPIGDTGDTLADLTPHYAPTPEALAIEADLRERALDALLGLPPRERAVLALRYGLASEMPASAVAEALGVAASTVTAITARGLERLREALGGEGVPIGGKASGAGPSPRARTAGGQAECNPRGSLTTGDHGTAGADRAR